MKISGINLPDNCTLTFTANSIKVRVSLNISKSLLKFVPKGKYSKGATHYVYWVSQDVELKYCSPKNLRGVYSDLLYKAMANVRRMKIELLNSQINSLEMGGVINRVSNQTGLNFK